MSTAVDPIVPAAEPEWRPRFNPWAIAMTVTLATFMEVLDTSIANVALPHIAGNLSISQDEATWVLTSYLVANAVILPISAWLSTKFGRKRFYMTCVVLFGIPSFKDATASSNYDPEGVVQQATRAIKAAFPEMECIVFPKDDYAAFWSLLRHLRGVFGKAILTGDDALRLTHLKQGFEVDCPNLASGQCAVDSVPECR